MTAIKFLVFSLFVIGASAIQLEFKSKSRARVRSAQEIQTIKDYLEQLKKDIRQDATQVLQDSVAEMQELTEAVKALKKKIESTVDRVNENAESNLLAVKAIEELIGFEEEPAPAKSAVQVQPAKLAEPAKSLLAIPKTPLV